MILLCSSSSLTICGWPESKAASREVSTCCWESSGGRDPSPSLTVCCNSCSCQVNISALFFLTHIFCLQHPTTGSHYTFFCLELNEPFANWYFLPVKVFEVTIKWWFISDSLNKPNPLLLTFTISSIHYTLFCSLFCVFSSLCSL